MTPLKSVAVLGLTLMALGLCATAPAAAQTSGQTKPVVPRHLQPLPEIDSVPQATPLADLQQEIFQDDESRRGMPTPRPIEIMMDEGQFDQAVKAFKKYMKTAQGSPCDLIYLPYTFYNRLLWEDTSKTAFYQEKVDFYIDKFLTTCGHTVEGYLLRETMMEPKIPDSTVVWMTKAIAVDSTVNRLYLMRAHALWELQRTQEACVDYRRAADKQNREAAELYERRCANQ